MSEPTMQVAPRRLVVIDIETAATDLGFYKGALDAMNGRVVCIGLLIDDGTSLEEIALTGDDEVEILKGFWNTVRPTDVLIGHNILDFDLPFIKQRSWILNVKPTRALDMRRYYTIEVRDTLQMWTNWGFKKGVTLEALASALKCGGKSGHGADVADWWTTRDLENIKAYCMNDVRVTYAIYCRLTYTQPRSAKDHAEQKTSVLKREHAMPFKARSGRRPSGPVLGNGDRKNATF